MPALYDPYRDRQIECLVFCLGNLSDLYIIRQFFNVDTNQASGQYANVIQMSIRSPKLLFTRYIPFDLCARFAYRVQKEQLFAPFSPITSITCSRHARRSWFYLHRSRQRHNHVTVGHTPTPRTVR